MASLRRIARRILGRRGTFILRNLLSAIYYLFGSCENSKPEGITAMVCTYNEEDWVDISLLSIKDLVDEYIVVDSSTDNTSQKILELKEKHKLPIRLYRIGAGDLVSARNLVLKEARYRWILLWDADFVATQRLVEKVRELTRQLPKDKCFLVYWKMVLLCGTPLHVCRNRYHVEHWMFTWSSKLRYKWLDSVESLFAPLYLYRVIYIDEPLGFHLSYVRSPKRLAMKMIWWRFKREADEFMRRGGSLEEFALKKARELYGMDSLEELGRRFIREMMEELPMCDEPICELIPRQVIERARKLGILADD